MRAETLSRTRIFRTNPALDAAVAAAVEREGSTASNWLRRAVASMVSAPPRPSIRLAPVPAVALAKVWPEVEAWLDRACRRTGCDLTVSELRELCEREQGMLFVMVGDEGRPVAAGVTQVRDHASGRRSCWILAVGGTRARDWLSTLEGIETGAAAISCSSVELVGRPGWARLLDGYATESCEAGLHFSKSLGAHS
ncbi:hypothetical protein FPV16_23450 [Methylobacterium sp. W2]|uniref:hypothetical protein n=1 Tax=Methylobacterium sp. W2 TaxID=2598107 RepID=UPI001D0C7CE3|nr:hypothetical protein [Methylobacterium sp. W2]MCC0809119.1 hypothetical protein [Methylobacterium sp. W2]